MIETEGNTYPFQPAPPVPLEKPMERESSVPRWWTPIAIAGISLASFVLASGVMLFVAIAVVHGELSVAILRNPDSIAEVTRSRLGLFLMLVVPQFGLVAPSILVAFLSPEPTHRRLGLVPGHWPVWTWFAAAAATPLVGIVSGAVLGIFMDKSENLEDMAKIFQEHGENGFLIPLMLMIGLTPAICEELLFRGFVQTRLVRSLGPLAGITIASVMFAAFHLDVVHVLAVLPLGLFLGWVSWQSGSLFPAMLGHFVNNAVSVYAAVKIAPAAESGIVTLPMAAFVFLVLSGGIAGLASVSVASLLYGRPQSQSAGIASCGSQPA